MEDNKALEVQQETGIAKTAGEVYEYVRGKLAPTVEKERTKVVTAMEETMDIMEITNATEYTAAVNARKVLMKAMKEGQATLDDMKKKAHGVWKAFTSSQNDIINNAEEEQKRIARLASAYDQEQERVRLQKQREAEAKARKEAEERVIEEAARLEELGDKEAAEEVISEPIAAPSVEIAKSTPQVEGSHYRDNWKVKKIDAAKLPREYMTPDLVKINKAVNMHKGDTNIAGVEVHNDRILVDRG